MFVCRYACFKYVCVHIWRSMFIYCNCIYRKQKRETVCAWSGVLGYSNERALRLIGWENNMKGNMVFSCIRQDQVHSWGLLVSGHSVFRLFYCLSNHHKVLIKGIKTLKQFSIWCQSVHYSPVLLKKYHLYLVKFWSVYKCLSFWQTKLYSVLTLFAVAIVLNAMLNFSSLNFSYDICDARDHPRKI